MKQYEYKGITDEETSCSCCGRVELKATIVLAVLDADGNATGEVTHFGRTCGARALGWNVKAVDVAVKNTKAEMARHAEAMDRAVRFHPLMLAKSAEITAFYNDPQHTYKDARAQGLLARWHAMEQQARQEVEA
jgi:hypothetical protein